MSSESLPPEICHEPTVCEGLDLEVCNENIKWLENELGIFHDLDRWNEASLFIDKEFLDTAVIAGQTKNLERLFGHIEWLGYLRARAFCADYGNQLLTPEFILGIHNQFLREQAPEYAGKYATGSYRGGRMTPDGHFVGIVHTAEEVETLEKNPFLRFEVEPNQPNERKGFIRYHCESRRKRLILFEKVCEWYNNERKDPSHDPYWLAACLEKFIVSIHGLAYGINGRVARAAMNWSLENDNCYPSAVQSFQSDILVPDRKWEAMVKEGSTIYEERNSLRFWGRAGMDPIDFFKLRAEHEEYRRIGVSAPTLGPGMRHSLGACEELIEDIMSGDSYSPYPMKFWFNTQGKLAAVPAT